jgi:chromosome segregation ATPase
MQLVKLEEQENKLGESIHTKYQNMLSSLGNLESRIIKLSNQLNELKEQKHLLHSELVQTENELAQFIENIGIKYGSGKLDFQSGTLTIE